MRTPKENFKISVLSSMGSVFMFILDKTLRFKRYNFKPEITPAIYVIWHGRQYPLLAIPPRENINILISQSNDGEIIARIVHDRRFATIRGSMGRGGVKALREVIKALKDGKSVAYTADGPKGPRLKVKEGVIKIAQMSQRPIIPLCGAVSLGYETNSWDKYQVPFPFAKAPVVFGEPIYVPKDLPEESIEDYRLEVENELFRLMAEADKKLKQ